VAQRRPAWIALQLRSGSLMHGAAQQRGDEALGDGSVHSANARCSGELRLTRVRGWRVRRVPAAQQQLEGAASLATERWCLLVALTGGAAGEEHSGSRGGRRAKCDEGKAKVKFALMMDVAQGILTVRKLWVGVHVGEKVGGSRSETVGTTTVCGRRRRRARHQACRGFSPESLGQAASGRFYSKCGVHCLSGSGP
jgi:hypothetical protein